MKNGLILALLLPNILLASNDKLDVKIEDAYPSVLPLAQSIQLEKARSPSARNWGMMGRASFPEQSGLLFIYPFPQHLSFWMFNCNFDLSIAYLDSDKVFREFYNMKANPKMMDPTRLVLSLDDLSKYPANDPVRVYFRSKSIHSRFPQRYALETNIGWFNSHQVQPGDLLHWEKGSNDGYITRGIDISPYLIHNAKYPIVLKLPENKYYSAWIKERQGKAKIAYLNDKGILINSGWLKGGEDMPDETKPVLVSKANSLYLIILNYTD